MADIQEKVGNQTQVEQQIVEKTDLNETSLSPENALKLKELEQRQDILEGSMSYLNGHEKGLGIRLEVLKKEYIAGNLSPDEADREGLTGGLTDEQELANADRNIVRLRGEYQKYADMLQSVKSEIAKIKAGGEITGEALQSIEKSHNDIETYIGEAEFSLGQDIIGENEAREMSVKAGELQTMNNENFLRIPENERLQYITKGNIDSSRIASGEIKNIEFNFDFDGKRNYELYKYTTAGQVLPNEVREVESNGIIYSRIGLNGEFYSGDRRFVIDTGTKMDVVKLASSDELTEMNKGMEEKYNKFVNDNKEYSSEIYSATIKEAFKKGLDEGEVKIVITQSYQDMQKLDVNKAKKVLVVSRHLDKGGFVDDSLDLGELITKLEELVGILNKYGYEGKYTINDAGDINFTDLGTDGLPNGLEVEPSLEKFVKVALSQLGTHEKSGIANKYLNGQNAMQIPWCAAYVNWCLEKSGYSGTGSNLAKSFINSSGYGHVGIKLGNKCLGGNQSNKVSLMNINKPIVGYSIPTKNGLEVHRLAGDPNKIPDGAIIVFDRNTKKDKSFA